MLRTIALCSFLWAACSFGAGLSGRGPSSPAPSSPPSEASGSSYEGVRAAPSPDPIAVPDVDGMTAERAEQAFRDAGFTGSITVKDTGGCEWKRAIDAGRVCGQNPVAGRTYNPRLPIELHIAKSRTNTRTAPMPAVIGLSLTDAVARLRDAGLPEPTVEVDWDAACATDVVCRQTPNPDTPASRQRPSRIYVGADRD